MSDYHGRHRSQEPPPYPLPSTVLDPADASVSVGLFDADRHVTLRGDFDEVRVRLHPSVRNRIVNAARAYDEAHQDPTDAAIASIGTGGGWSETNERTMRVVRGLANGEL